MVSVRELISQRQKNASTPNKRTDPYTLALSIEGGSMRGAVAAGMATEIEAAGLTPIFDRIYGTSVGALTGAYMATGIANDSVNLFAAAAAGGLFRKMPHYIHGWLDLHWLFDIGVDQLYPLHYDVAVTAQPSIHPLITKAGWRRADDGFIRYHPATGMELRHLIQSACRMPIIAGLPIGELRGGLWDAAQHEPWPLLTPLAKDVTHLLVLRSTADKKIRHGTGWRKTVGSVSGQLGHAITQSAGAVLYNTYSDIMDTFVSAGNVDQIVPAEAVLTSGERDQNVIANGVAHGQHQAKLYLQNVVSI